MDKVSKPYSPLNGTRSLFNNQRQSDVRFLVEGQTVYGHKFVLAMGSPVFYSMFYGDLKETREMIEIQDVSLHGFKNALRYIYGFQIDFEISELYESYLAGDKYLLHHFREAFFEYIKDKLNSENCILLYEQLAKIGKEEIPLADVRSMIVTNIKSGFKSEHFMQIDQETLISLLSLDELNIAEIDLLVAVSKWVDTQVQRQGLVANCGNKRKVFEPIKSYILFTAMKPEEIANCKEIAGLLTAEERGSVVLHLLNKKNPSTIELKTSRKARYSAPAIPFSVFVSDSVSINRIFYTRSVYLKVNRRLSIQTIYTTYSLRAANLSLQIHDPADVTLHLKMNKVEKDGKWGFSFDPHLDLKPGKWYQLSFTGDGLTKRSDRFSQQRELNYENSTFFHFYIHNDIFHCVRGFDFFPLDWSVSGSDCFVNFV